MKTLFVFFVLIGQCVFAQTTVALSQIQNWRQVSPKEIVQDSVRHAGTQLAIGQVRISVDWIAAWKSAVHLSGYDYFRIADVPDQPNHPILITCDDAACSIGHRCEDTWPFWFHRLSSCGVAGRASQIPAI